jgi:hypothetical protein
MQQYRSSIQRLCKIIPFIGIVVVLANAGNVVRRKGYLFGTLEIALDICPIICLIKAALEVYTGDLIPEKSVSPAAPLEATA